MAGCPLAYTKALLAGATSTTPGSGSKSSVFLKRRILVF
jgi:hypothetical protein